MKKFIIFTICASFISLYYVHQKVELYTLGYGLQKNRKHLSYLVDENSKLMYELSKIESPKFLLTSLDEKGIEFADSRTREENSNYFASDIYPEEAVHDGLLVRVFDIFTASAEARPGSK
jgi:hypothetical protein